MFADGRMLDLEGIKWGVNNPRRPTLWYWGQMAIKKKFNQEKWTGWSRSRTSLWIFCMCHYNLETLQILIYIECRVLRSEEGQTDRFKRIIKLIKPPRWKSIDLSHAVLNQRSQSLNRGNAGCTPSVSPCWWLIGFEKWYFGHSYAQRTYGETWPLFYRSHTKIKKQIFRTRTIAKCPLSSE
jgi:hypothetical protein